MNRSLPIVLAAGFLFLAWVFLMVRGQRNRLQSLQARGIYPAPGAESDADVRRLLESGEKILAIRCYRSLHNVGLKEAKEAVEALEQRPD